MKKIIITKNCTCEKDLHEITKYPRKGLTVQIFEKGDELEFIEERKNYFGTFYHVKTKKGTGDILASNAKFVEN